MRRAAWCLGLVACAPAVIRGDLAARDPSVHWPDGFVPEEAVLFAHNHRRIHAPCRRVWDLLVAAPRWPAWYANASDVRIDAGGDTLTAGASFHWTTFGLAVTSTVHELVPGARLSWFGHADGLEAYHAWKLVPASDGCEVVTEEASKGPGARALRERDPGAIHAGHDRWLADLQAVLASTAASRRSPWRSGSSQASLCATCGVAPPGRSPADDDDVADAGAVARRIRRPFRRAPRVIRRGA